MEISSMPDFCPDGYVSTPDAIATAAAHWFPEQINALEMSSWSQPGSKPENPIDAAVRAFSQPQVPEGLVHAFSEIADPTVHRLRNCLHQGELDAHYFANNGRHTVPREFWATAEANGVLELGIFWPFGAPNRIHEQRPNYPLFLQVLDLQKLLSEEAVKKRPLPESKKPELVTALRRLDHLPNRAAQLKALREEFHDYKITHEVFRELAKILPRSSGHQSRRPS
jgi:hypothetical protein